MSVFFILVAFGFIAGAVGYVLSQGWWAPLLNGTALLSTILYIVLWDGQGTQRLSKGALGVPINSVIVVWVLILN